MFMVLSCSALKLSLLLYVGPVSGYRSSGGVGVSTIARLCRAVVASSSESVLGAAGVFMDLKRKDSTQLPTRRVGVL